MHLPDREADCLWQVSSLPYPADEHFLHLRLVATLKLKMCSRTWETGGNPRWGDWLQTSVAVGIFWTCHLLVLGKTIPVSSFRSARAHGQHEQASVAKAKDKRLKVLESKHFCLKALQLILLLPFRCKGLTISQTELKVCFQLSGQCTPLIPSCVSFLMGLGKIPYT